jgi:hypothetical protein
MRAFPLGVEREVVRRLYEEAERLDWIHMPLNERRRQYAAWLEAPTIGGVLTQFLSRESARVWIKDCPMKEFARAVAGVGRFAPFVGNTGRGPLEMIQLSLGSEWVLVQGSFGIKPLHCLAEAQNQRRYICWGPPKDFKHLLWAALGAAESKKVPARIVVVERIGQEMRGVDRTRFERLVARCSLEFSSLRLG